MTRSYTDLELRVRDFARKITDREEGASLVEYTLLVGLIAMVCIAAVSLLAGPTGDMLSEASTGLQ